MVVEPGSNRARALWNDEIPVATSWITFAEVSAAIARARRSRRMSARSAEGALRRLRTDWASLAALLVDVDIASRAGELAVRHRLRGMDSIHLATALLLPVASPVVVTWDDDLRRSAGAEGLVVAP